MNARWLPIGAALLGGCCIIGGGEYAPTVDEGFVSLFNGRDLSGWTGATDCFGVTQAEFAMRGTKAKKQVPVLTCIKGIDEIPADRRCDLMTEKEYRDFILRFEFCMPTNSADSGIGIRMEPGKDAAFYGMGEVQLIDDGGDEYYDRAAKQDRLAAWRYSGSLYGVLPARKDNFDRQIWGKEKNFTAGGSYIRRVGMWNFGEIKVVGSTIEVMINGYVIAKGDVAKFKGDGDTLDMRKHPGLHRKSGLIGILGHTKGVMFKNLRIKELTDEEAPIDATTPGADFEQYFTGAPEQLTKNWKGVTTEKKFDNPIVRHAASAADQILLQDLANEARDQHWKVENGVLHFDGFRGGYSLATKRNYADFEMWADWRILSITGDSGLYLRGSPQVQIWDAHNQWGIGSGGLYNNQKNPSSALTIADRQVGDWNRFHIIMRGEKVTVWLNGELVVDNVTLENFWDRKQPIFTCEQIELQCHGDPTEWKNIYIKEL